jgi:hypothetical protein
MHRSEKKQKENPYVSYFIHFESSADTLDKKKEDYKSLW